MEKPITLQIEEFRKTIAETIQSSNLPIFLLDYLFRDFYSEIHLLNQNQTQQDGVSYASSIKSENESHGIS